MNHMVKKSAVKKYSQAAGTPDEIKAQIAADEKGYTPEEVDEILASLDDSEPEVDPFGKQNYQEWEVKIENKEAKKLTISRQRVRITDDQADVLNIGALEGNNTYAKMYFK